jgi:phosphoribosylformylglycinamidine synthase I
LIEADFMPMKPKALVLLAYGTNRDQDVAEALSLAGAEPVIVPLNDLRDGKQKFSDFQMVVLPGGFSYADALGAGRLLATDLNTYFVEEMTAFVNSGRPVIGICNGFQALVKSGILPGVSAAADGRSKATLTFNAEGHFECRWVDLQPISQTCIWTRGLDEMISCPIAHGEGNFQVDDPKLLNMLTAQDQVALTYVHPDGSPSKGEYPANPNGSVLDIAGVTNPQGNVLGLMPHPENHIYDWQHRRRTRGVQAGSGLALFVNGVEYARSM